MRRIYFMSCVCIMAMLACNKNDDSVSAEMELQKAPPQSFSLIDVPDSSTNVSLLPVLSWESAKNPEGSDVTYDLYLGEETNPTSLYSGDIDGTSFELTEQLNLITNYYWKVLATDTQGQTSQSSSNSFTTRNLMIPELPEQIDSNFPVRVSHTSLSYNNTLWILGGQISFSQVYNDVWSSENGNGWNEVGSDVLISPKFGHTSVVYDDKMWILGGHTKRPGENAFISHDVWSSSDGSDWNNMTSYTNFFPARSWHSSVVHDDKIYVIGGRDDNGVKNDIWQYDGSWSEVATSSPIFGERAGHSSVVYDGKIWVIGGSDSFESKNDVWYSSNGSDWTLATAEADFPPTAFHKAVVFGGKLWLVGVSGETPNFWYTSNGVNWISVQLPEEMKGRYGQSVTVHNDKLYLTGGVIDRVNEEIINDVWILE